MKERAADLRLCWHNDICRQEAISKSNDLGNKADQLASLSGFPWASRVAKPVVSYTSLLVFLLSLGAGLKKKEAKIG